MKKAAILFLSVFGLGIGVVNAAACDANCAQTCDARLTNFRTTLTPYELPRYEEKAAWLKRAEELRRHILICMGLWPMPSRTPLNAQISGRIERQGYSIETVCFESFPGLFVTGNLYRPVGRGGPFPAVLSAHGHWSNGRFENSEAASVPGRAINLARQGYVVFSYSMLGFNESWNQVPHCIDGAREQLWAVSSMGIQLWNSIRALDFLCSLPDVDKKRIGMTGASGGGTQTFMLCAVDERLKVAAPVNMVSLHFQGGCVCENAPNLRIGANNVEIAALFAPKPLLLVSTSGDWTKNTPQVEYPAIKGIYGLLGAEDRVENAHFNCQHNYNKDSREAVYAFFAKWLCPGVPVNTKEVEFTVEPQENLRAFGWPPAGAATKDQLVEYLISRHSQAIDESLPSNFLRLQRYRKVFGPVLQAAVCAEYPSAGQIISSAAECNGPVSLLYLGRQGVGDRIPAALLKSGQVAQKEIVLIADGAGPRGQLDGMIVRSGSIAQGLLAKGRDVFIVAPFPAGAEVNIPKEISHLTTYNRCEAASAVQDIITACAFLRESCGYRRITTVGLGHTGLKVMLAAALTRDIDSVVVDVDNFDNTSDGAFVERLNIPLLRRAGDLTTAGALIAPRRLLLFDTGRKFSSDKIRKVYRVAGVGGNLTIFEADLTTECVVEQIIEAGEKLSWRSRLGLK